jgi:Ser/Thr protein kinase RdoA (MazF antagonist)
MRNSVLSPMSIDALPVMYSTLAPQAVVEQVVPNYELPRIRACQFWHRGLSDVYLLETVDQPYILRISHCHWRNRSEIEFELELLDYLRQQQVPVAYPLRTKDGFLFIEINAPEGKRYASLFIYAPGEIPLGDLNVGQAHKLGATVAQVHQAGLAFRPSGKRKTLDLNYLLDDSWRSLSPFLEAEDAILVEETILEIKAKLKDFPQEAPYWVVCWGDPHSGNAHFTPDDQVTLFDFDQCGYGWRAFEMGKFRQLALTTGISPTVREAFLSGYSSLNPLTDFELDAIPALTQMAHLWVWSISLTYAIRHNYSRLDESYFRVRSNQLKRFRSHDWQAF